MAIYTATTLQGLENVLSNELTDLGATISEVHNRAVTFEGDLAMLYRANLCLRTALHILQPIHQFTARSDEELYKQVNAIDWKQYFDIDQSFAIYPTIYSEYFQHSQFAALRVKDAIADRFRADFGGRRPAVDKANPDFKIYIHIKGSTCSLLLDSSGESLHKRGYRTEANQAPLNEVLAAGMILMTNWRGQSNFIDYMCGSGTLLIEATMIALRHAPNLYREQFAFMQWRNYDEKLFNRTCHEVADQQLDEWEHWAIGGDINAQTIQIARQNVQRAQLEDYIRLSVKDFMNSQLPNNGGMLMMNPPYDMRLQDDDIVAFYKNMGDTLKKNYQNTQAWILSGNMEALKNIGLRPTRKIKLLNATIECGFYCYELYEGSKKTPKNEQQDPDNEPF
jgi:putative N6-adenine-specific DNA methylase